MQSQHGAGGGGGWARRLGAAARIVCIACSDGSMIEDLKYALQCNTMVMQPACKSTIIDGQNLDNRNAHINFAQYLFSNRKYRKGRVIAMAALSSEDNRKRCPGFFTG